MSDVDSAGEQPMFFHKVAVMGGEAQGWSLIFGLDEMRDMLHGLFGLAAWSYSESGMDGPKVDFELMKPEGSDQEELWGVVELRDRQGMFFSALTMPQLQAFLAAFARHFPENGSMVLGIDDYRAFYYTPEAGKTPDISLLEDGFDIELSRALYPYNWQ